MQEFRIEITDEDKKIKGIGTFKTLEYYKIFSNELYKLSNKKITIKIYDTSTEAVVYSLGG